MLYKAAVAVCSQINTRHISTVWGQKVKFLNVNPYPANVDNMATSYQC